MESQELSETVDILKYEESDEGDTSNSMIACKLDWKRETMNFFRNAALKRTRRANKGFFHTEVSNQFSREIQEQSIDFSGQVNSTNLV